MSKFVDVASITQVIGCVYTNPAILDQTDKYTITDDDFPDRFHKITFGVIYKCARTSRAPTYEKKR